MSPESVILWPFVALIALVVGATWRPARPRGFMILVVVAFIASAVLGGVSAVQDAHAAKAETGRSTHHEPTRAEVLASLTDYIERSCLSGGNARGYCHCYAVRSMELMQEPGRLSGVEEGEAEAREARAYCGAPA